jgi:hypothetical protein
MWTSVLFIIIMAILKIDFDGKMAIWGLLLAVGTFCFGAQVESKNSR